MPLGPVRVDRVVDVTRAVLLAPQAGRRIVVTRWGLVLVTEQRGWTWYRWVMAGRWWSVTQEGPVPSARVLTRRAAVLLRQARERARRKT